MEHSITEYPELEGPTRIIESDCWTDKRAKVAEAEGSAKEGEGAESKRGGFQCSLFAYLGVQLIVNDKVNALDFWKC